MSPRRDRSLTALAGTGSRRRFDRDLRFLHRLDIGEESLDDGRVRLRTLVQPPDGSPSTAGARDMTAAI